ncbi:MAG: heparinase II/III domain-containing protein [Candidatus Helarchaeota archaeon]
MRKTPFFTRQFETVFFVILILSGLGISLFFVFNDLFPNNGGFTRNILFIKPSQNGDSGFFLIIDKVNPTKSKMPVDWILHGRGNLSIFNINQSAVWKVKSYLNPNISVKLHAIFIEPEVIISKDLGPFYPTQTYVDNPYMIPYIKVRSTRSGATRFVTLLYPLNGSQALPTITTNREIGVTKISDDNLLFTQSVNKLRNFEKYSTDAQTLFVRMNSSDISSYVLQRGHLLTYSNRSYLESEKVISINLEYKASNLSGMVWVGGPTVLSIWVPNVPKNTLLNGKDISASYNPGNETLSLTIAENGFLLISYDPVKSRPPDITSRSLKSSHPSVKNGLFKAYGTHPFLYFNETTLPALRNRVLTQEPWQNWFQQLEADARMHLDDNISTMGGNQRFEPALNLAFVGIIEQNTTYMTKAKEFLQAMNQVTAYEIHLRRARACGHYALAFDMLYQNLSSTERREIADKLGNHTLPLVQKLDAIPLNNHIGVVSSGLGLAGLTLNEPDWVNAAISGIESYFTTSFAVEGGDYEGYSYAGYFLESGLKFFYALQKAGGKNYFADPRFLAFINNTIYSLSPLTTTAVFEDSTVNPQLIEDLLWATASIYPYAPILSNYSQWAYNNRLLNDALTYDGAYLDSSESSTSGFVSRICMYSMNITPLQPPLSTLIVWPDSGLAFLRNNWGPDSLYLSITCKNKAEYQYHAHYDENSFELWAYGAWLAANPGYPGYGKGLYDDIIQTRASNTLLINEKGQQRVDADGFQMYYRSSEIDGVVASASNIYSSPGSLSQNYYFLVVFILFYLILIIVSILILYLRHRGYHTNVVITPHQQPYSLFSIRTKNLSLKIHLGLLFGLTFGVFLSLIPFFLSTNEYIAGYLVGKHSHIANLVPIIEIILLILTPILLIIIYALKFKMQDAIVRRVIIFSTKLKDPQIPPLRESIILSYLPQVFFLIFFIPIIFFLYLPILQNLVKFILTQSGSLLDLQNTIIASLDQFIVLFALTLLAYLPFKLCGLYLGGRAISRKLENSTSVGLLQISVSYLLIFTTFILLIFFVTIAFFYALNFLGVSIIL